MSCDRHQTYITLLLFLWRHLGSWTWSRALSRLCLSVCLPSVILHHVPRSVRLESCCVFASFVNLSVETRFELSAHRLIVLCAATSKQFSAANQYVMAAAAARVGNSASARR